jgi:hypothetical protein
LLCVTTNFLAFYVVHVVSNEKKKGKGKAIPVTGREGL